MESTRGYRAGMPVFLDWRQAATPNDLAREIAQSLADGALAALPTEAGYMIVADPARLSDPTRPHRYLMASAIRLDILRS
jgi:hypothetical protein